MFPGALKATLVSLIFQGLVMAGVYALNGQALLSSLTFAFTAISTFIGYLYMRRRFQRVTEHGSVLETQLADDEETGGKLIQSKIARKYVHPGLEPLPPLVNRSGVTAEELEARLGASGEAKEMDSPQSAQSADTQVEEARGADIEAVESGLVDEMKQDELAAAESGTSIYAEARSA